MPKECCGSKESTPTSESDSIASSSEGITLVKKRHAKYFLRFLNILPAERMASYESSRMTILFFAISGLDVLGALEHSLSYERRAEIIEWIYSCQADTGFVGSTFLRSDNVILSSKSVHVAMTYTALASLVILGDDLSRVNRKGLLQGLKDLQNPDGSFNASQEEVMCDMRFVFCAASVMTMLNDTGDVDISAMIDYVLRSQSYEGAFGQGPGMEAHGGSSFCAVATLSMFKNHCTHWSVEDRERCLKWCSMRLNEGFNGRPDKKDDTCYTFWVGATLKLLNDEQENSFANAEILHCLDFVLSTQDGITGGLAKWPELSPDPLHTYLGLAGLALAPFAGLRPVDPQLNITKRARAFVDNLHDQSS